MAVDPAWGTLFVSICGGIATLSAAAVAIITARKAATKAEETHVLVNSNLIFIRRMLAGALVCVVCLIGVIVKQQESRK